MIPVVSALNMVYSNSFFNLRMNWTEKTAGFTLGSVPGGEIRCPPVIRIHSIYGQAKSNIKRGDKWLNLGILWKSSSC